METFNAILVKLLVETYEHTREKSLTKIRNSSNKK